jgi:outer membrane protein assembly factor BamB
LSARNVNPDERVLVGRNRASGRQQWSYTLPEGLRDVYAKIDGGTVAVWIAPDTAQILDASNGVERFQVAAPPLGLSVVGGVLIRSDTDDVVGIDGRSGTELWRVVGVQPVFWLTDGDRIMYGALPQDRSTGTSAPVVAIDTRTGATTAPIPTMQSYPAATGESFTLFLDRDRTTLTVVTTVTGHERWRFASDVVISSATIAGDRVAVATGCYSDEA